MIFKKARECPGFGALVTQVSTSRMAKVRSRTLEATFFVIPGISATQVQGLEFSVLGF